MPAVVTVPKRLTVAAAAAAIAMGLCGPRAARADEAAAALAKYRKPVAQAIDRALAYLAKQQRPDGSFPSGMPGNTAIPSLGVMAFLAKGYTPGTGPYGQVVNRGVDFVLGSQQSNGLLVRERHAHGAMYSHCISTLMLSEVSGMVDPARQKRIDKALPEALKVILSAQEIRKSAQHQGGWRYQHTSRDSDISCSGWAIMSLRSARNNGTSVPKRAVDEGIKFIMNCRSPDGGFCYQPGGRPGLARAGTALLCLELCGHHRSKPAVGAGDYILGYLNARKQLRDRWTARAERLKSSGLRGRRLAQVPSALRFGGSHFYYGLYYCSQGMFQLGGQYWETFATYLYEMMLKFQQLDGSWPQGRRDTGPCYATAMGVLAMSVSYRQLPIYQR